MHFWINPSRVKNTIKAGLDNFGESSKGKLDFESIQSGHSINRNQHLWAKKQSVKTDTDTHIKRKTILNVSVQQ